MKKNNPDLLVAR